MSPTLPLLRPRLLPLALVFAAHGALLLALLHAHPAAVVPPAPEASLQLTLLPPAPLPMKTPPRPPQPPHPTPPPVQPVHPQPLAPTPRPTPQAQAVVTPPPPAAQTVAQETPAPPPPKAAVVPDPPPPPPAHAEASRIGNDDPPYPALSQRLGEQGRAVVTVCVKTDGSAESTSLKQSSGYSRLDAAALKAIAGWHFAPATLGGQPVTSCYAQPVDFRLTSAHH